MGPGARNLDGVLHAGVDGPSVVTPYGTGYVVGFEDLFGGGAQDYDDNRLQFEGGVVAVPEPSLLALFALGAGGLKLARHRRP